MYALLFCDFLSSEVVAAFDGDHAVVLVVNVSRRLMRGSTVGVGRIVVCLCVLDSAREWFRLSSSDWCAAELGPQGVDIDGRVSFVGSAKLGLLMLPIHVF